MQSSANAHIPTQEQSSSVGAAAPKRPVFHTSFFKELGRSISSSWGRFLALLGIVALGCGFYAGLQMTGLDMRLAADNLYDKTQLYDLRLISTGGFSDTQLDELRQHDKVESAWGSRSVDVMAQLNGEQYAMRIESIDAALIAQSSALSAGKETLQPKPDVLNYITLVRGRWPEGPGECVMSADRLFGRPCELGDQLELISRAQDMSDQLRVSHFEVVGLVLSPVYVSTSNLGPTSIGSGKIEQFVYVLPESFVEDFPMSQIYLSAQGARDELSGGKRYTEVVERLADELEAQSDELASERLSDIQREAQEKLDDERATYERERDDAYKKLAEAEKKLEDSERTLRDAETQLQDGQARYDAGLQELEDSELLANQQFEAAQRQLNESAALLSAAASGAALDPAQLEQQRIELQQAQAALDQQRSEAQLSFAQARAQLSESLTELEDAQRELDQGWIEYDAGRADYERERADAEATLSDAQKKIEDAQADIDALEAPDIYILDRTKNPSIESYQSDSERIDSIAQVFPLIFFLVAALVALTTMTRMVDDERQEIGTYKALGYTTGRISAKYLMYAACASLAGAVLGIVILSQLLPHIICIAYDILYNVPIAALPLPINLPIAARAAALGVGVTLFASWFAAATSLQDSPARLMLPRAPRAGRRILLERIGPIWRRTSFSWKVSLRNLFRYKRRFTMTVVGIAGCTALLLTGLGLHDSIWDIIDKQFKSIVHYDASISLNDEADEADFARVTELIGDFSTEADEARVQVLNMQLGSPSHAPISTQLIIPQDTKTFSQLITLQERIGGKPIKLGTEGVVITEKLASTLGLQPGGTLTVYEQDDIGNAIGTGTKLTVSDICENYVYNYCYLDAALYENTFGKQAQFSTLLAKIDADPAVHSELSEALHELDVVDTVSYNDEVIDSYRKSLRSVNMIVVVLVVAAAALAFIVLYNLTNINIVERTREIASLKVLGFTPREVNAYVNRETIVLTAIGAACGLVLGTILEGFVVVSSEVELVMFGRDIHLSSYLTAFALTLVFSVVVMLFMRPKLSAIDMVESLKSID